MPKQHVFFFPSSKKSPVFVRVVQPAGWDANLKRTPHPPTLFPLWCQKGNTYWALCLLCTLVFEKTNLQQSVAFGQDANSFWFCVGGCKQRATWPVCFRFSSAWNPLAILAEGDGGVQKEGKWDHERHFVFHLVFSVLSCDSLEVLECCRWRHSGPSKLTFCTSRFRLTVCLALTWQQQGAVFPIRPNFVMF